MQIVPPPTIPNWPLITILPTLVLIKCHHPPCIIWGSDRPFCVPFAMREHSSVTAPPTITPSLISYQSVPNCFGKWSVLQGPLKASQFSTFLQHIHVNMPTFPEPFYPSFYCLPQQFWHFYFPLLSLSFQESCRQLVSTVSQGPFLYRGRVKSCITGECSCFDQFFLIQLSVLSALDSAPSGSGLINAIWLCRYVMARSCRVPFSPQQTQYLTGQVSTI